MNKESKEDIKIGIAFYPKEQKVGMSRLHGTPCIVQVSFDFET